MTAFWAWVAEGCVACAVVGFTVTRFGVPRLFGPAHPVSVPERTAAPGAAAASPEVVRPLEATSDLPAPTAPQPEAAKLELWTRQVTAGERTMSMATDGCRVTWNRTCKHGHPTWLVHLGYLEVP